MEQEFDGDRDSPAFESMKRIIHDAYPEVLYERDLFIDAIPQTRTRKRAAAFSHEIMGTDGAIHLTNKDYRMLLGLLSHAYERIHKKTPATTLLLPALQTFEELCSPGARVLSDRIQSLLAPDAVQEKGPKSSPKQRLLDIINLLELSYPLGTSMTDPDGGAETMIPANALVNVQSFEEGVADQIRIQPIKNRTTVLATNQSDGSACRNQIEIVEPSMAHIGHGRFHTHFFRQAFAQALCLHPSIDVGDAAARPGTLVVLRHASHVAVMVKHVLRYATPQENIAEDVQGGVAVGVKKQTKNTERREEPISTVSISRRLPNGGFDVASPDVTYEFFDRAPDGRGAITFGASVKRERPSA